MDSDGIILALDDTMMDFEEYSVALGNEGINVELVLDSDEFMDILTSLPEDPDAPLKYSAISLDFKIDAPRINLPNSFGGDWILNEVLRRPNMYLTAAQYKKISALPITFLTMYSSDPRLADEFARKNDFRVISKSDDDSVSTYVEWSKRAIAAHAVQTRYNDAGVALCRILIDLGLDSQCAGAILRGGSVSDARYDLADLWGHFRGAFPVREGINPGAVADRWEVVCGIILDACAVFSFNFVAARVYLDHEVEALGMRSPIEVMRDGSFSELAEMKRFLDNSWGRL